MKMEMALKLWAVRAASGFIGDSTSDLLLGN
jgi:hypothetical protein